MIDWMKRGEGKTSNTNLLLIRSGHTNLWQIESFFRGKTINEILIYNGNFHKHI